MVDMLGDLKQEIRDLMRRIRVLESTSPLGYSSITEGALEIRSEEGLIVEGSARISGVLKGDGTITWTGPWKLTGVGTVTGDAAWSGDLDLIGAMNVQSGGQVVIRGGGGDVVLSSTYDAPRVNLGGAQIDGGANSFTFTAGTTTVYFANHTIRIPGMPTRTGTGLPAGAVGADPDGTLWRAI